MGAAGRSRDLRGFGKVRCSAQPLPQLISALLCSRSGEAAHRYAQRRGQGGPSEEAQNHVAGRIILVNWSIYRLE